jgi:hypothetical protein
MCHRIGRIDMQFDCGPVSESTLSKWRVLHQGEYRVWLNLPVYRRLHWRLLPRTSGKCVEYIVLIIITD